MTFRASLAFVAAIATLTISAVAGATSFVGSWRVDSGPSYDAFAPPAYTGQEAAALLFGGLASQYAISTVDANVGHIDNLAWVSTMEGACAGGAFPCGTKVAEDFKVSTGGLYASLGDVSAYVIDWAQGPEYVNYAFRTVPEPAAWMLMIGGFGLTGFAMRRRRLAPVS